MHRAVAKSSICWWQLRTGFVCAIDRTRCGSRQRGTSGDSSISNGRDSRRCHACWSHRPVHSRGSLATNPWRSEGERIFGPGIFDMKANCVLALEALRAFEHTGVRPSHGVTLALTCDEEVGSFSGWPLLERLARDHQPTCAFVYSHPLQDELRLVAKERRCLRWLRKGAPPTPV